MMDDDLSVPVQLSAPVDLGKIEIVGLTEITLEGRERFRIFLTNFIASAVSDGDFRITVDPNGDAKVEDIPAEEGQIYAVGYDFGYIRNAENLYPEKVVIGRYREPFDYREIEYCGRHGREFKRRLIKKKGKGR